MNELTCGSIIKHDGLESIVVRLVDSITLFETLEECYLLEEKYAELRTSTGKIVFKTFVQHKHVIDKPNPEMKGLNPSVWKKF